MNYWFINSMDKSQHHYTEKKKSGAKECVAFGFLYKQLKIRQKWFVVIELRAGLPQSQGGGCLGKGTEEFMGRWEYSVSCLRWLHQVCLCQTKWISLNYTFKKYVLYVYKLYHYISLFSVYIITPVAICLAQHCYIQYFLVLILFPGLKLFPENMFPFIS